MKNCKGAEDLPEVVDIRQRLKEEAEDLEDFNLELSELLDDDEDRRPGASNWNVYPPK